MATTEHSSTVVKYNLVTGEKSMSDTVTDEEVRLNTVLNDTQVALVTGLSANTTTAEGEFFVANNFIFKKLVDGWELVGILPAAMGGAEKFTSS